MYVFLCSFKVFLRLKIIFDGDMFVLYGLIKYLCFSWLLVFIFLKESGNCSYYIRFIL